MGSLKCNIVYYLTYVKEYISCRTYILKHNRTFMNLQSIKNITNSTETADVLPNPSPCVPSRHHHQIAFYPVLYFVCRIGRTYLGPEARNGRRLPLLVICVNITWLYFCIRAITTVIAIIITFR